MNVLWKNLGRTAVNTLHKELEYHIQKLLEQTIFEKYKNKVGQMVLVQLLEWIMKKILLLK